MDGNEQDDSQGHNKEFAKWTSTIIERLKWLSTTDERLENKVGELYDKIDALSEKVDAKINALSDKVDGKVNRIIIGAAGGAFTMLIGIVLALLAWILNK